MEGQGGGGAAAKAAPDGGGGGDADPDADVFDVGLLEQLESLGFPRLVCKKALFNTGGAASAIGQQSDPNTRAAIVERAMMWCFEHMEDADIAEPVDFAAQSQQQLRQQSEDPYEGYFDASLVTVLQEMGFSTPRAHRGLFFTGNSSVEAAMEWIIGHSLDDDIDEPLDPEEVNSGPPDPCEELVRAMRPPLDLMLEQRLMGLCEMILRLQERHVFSREGDLKVAEGLLRVLGMPLESTMGCPDAPVCACRAIKAFAEMSDDLRGFFARHEALTIVLSCLERGDAMLTEEAISCIDQITGPRGLPRQLVEDGALDTVLGTLDSQPGRAVPRFASKALKLARKICGQLRGTSVSGRSLDKLCMLVVADDPVPALGAAQCFERLLAQHRVAGESAGGFPVKLIEMEDGVVAKALLGKLRSPPKPTYKDSCMFSCACELLTSLCIASEDAGLRLIEQGLLNAVISAISGGADFQATWTLAQTLLIFVFDGHACLVPVAKQEEEDDDLALDGGDTVEILSRGSNTRQQYSNGVVVRNHRDGSYVVDSIDGQNDGEPTSRDRLRKWMEPLESAAELPMSAARLRDRFALELLPALLAKCQKQVHRALLSTLLLFVDRLALAGSGKNVWVDENGEAVEVSADQLSHIARIAQSLVGMEPWSAHLQGLRLVGSLLVLLPSSVIQLDRHGVLERVQDLFTSSWNPAFDGDGRRSQMSQTDAQKKAVADTANRCLAAAETARADAVDGSAKQRDELRSLRDNIERGDESSVTALVALCCARDGITLHEFQEAELAESLLKFAMPTSTGIDGQRMETLSRIMTHRVREGSPRGAKRGADRVVDLLHGLLRVGDQLPLFLHGLPGAHGLSSLLKQVRVRFELLPGSQATEIGSREVAVQPVASMAEIHKYILDHARSTDERYLEYCEQLVGCRIKQHYSDKPPSHANVMCFHSETGEHTVIHERCGTTARLMLVNADFSVVRGRTPRSAAAARRQSVASRKVAAEQQRLLQARQQDEAAMAKARAKSRRERMEALQREEEAWQEVVEAEERGETEAEELERARPRARISLDEDTAADRWRLCIHLGERQPQAARIQADELTAPALKLTSTGAVSAKAGWKSFASSDIDAVRLQLRSRGIKTWSIYEPESQCVVHGSHDQEELTPDTTEVLILALNPSTRYEACLKVRSSDSGEWSESGPVATVYTGDSVIPDPSAVWEWERSPGEFDEYDQDSTTKLEEMFTSSNQESLHDLVIPGTDTRFQFDLVRMIQTNENSGASRRVRRISDEVALKTLALSHHERVCVRSPQGRWIPGVISLAHSDGTFDVECDTGADKKALRREDMLSLARAAKVGRRISSRRTSSLTRSWSALDLNSARSHRGSRSPVSARQDGPDPPALDLDDEVADDDDCECEPVPRRKKLQVTCFFGGFHYNDEGDASSKTRSDGNSFCAIELAASCTAFEALGRASGLVTNDTANGEGTGLWVVKGCYAKYLALLHRMDNTVIGGWLDSRGGHMTKRCSGTLINGELKLSQAGECVYTATVSGNEMSGSWRQRGPSKNASKKSATKNKGGGGGIEKGFLAKEVAENHPAHSAHPIERTDRASSWRCDVCGAGNSATSSNRRYRCVAGCDFDMCGTCRDAGKKGKGTFKATRESQSSRGRSKTALLWEVPFAVRYKIKCVDDEAEPAKNTTRLPDDACRGTIWCPHVDCTESLQTFPDRAACYKHMAAAHPTQLTNTAPTLGAVDRAALSACKPCFEPALMLLQVLHADPQIRKAVASSAWQSLGLAHQLSRQLTDPLSIATNVLPDWCSVLLQNSKQLFTLQARKQYFMLTAFGPSRAIAWFQAKQIAEAEAAANGGQSTPRTPRGPGAGPMTIPVLGALTVALVQVSRHNFLQEAAQLLATHAKDRSELRVEFQGEPGTGKGVWPEFFSKASTELQRRWQPALPNTTEGDEKQIQTMLPRLWVDGDEGAGGAVGRYVELQLFPRPLPVGTSSSSLEGTLCWYRFLGRLFGKALLDSRQDCVRLVPMPLHPLFFELLLDQLPVFTQQQRWTALGRLAAEDDWPGHALILGAIAAASGPSTDGSCVMPYSQRLPVDEWLECACFEDPVTGVPLKQGGEVQHLSLGNLAEYLDLVFDTWLGDGVARQIEACRAGFAEVASGGSGLGPSSSALLGSLADQAATYTYSQRGTTRLRTALQIFTPSELQRLLCGEAAVEWTLGELRQTVKPGYGTCCAALHRPVHTRAYVCSGAKSIVCCALYVCSLHRHRHGIRLAARGAGCYDAARALCLFILHHIVTEAATRWARAATEGRDRGTRVTTLPCMQPCHSRSAERPSRMVGAQVDRLRSDDSGGGSSSPDTDGTRMRSGGAGGSMDPEDAMLPTARTCTQQLRLPSYSSREQLGTMLRMALTHGTEGFGLE